MGQIILLAFAASVFPTLLACVAIMISREEPRRLLLAFYAGGMMTSITAGIIVLDIFDSGKEALGSSSSNPHPALSIIAGVVALALAWLMASRHGAEIIARRRAKRAEAHPKPVEDKGPSWAERHLGQASAKVAFAVGAVINLPGPFYLLALGDMHSGGYTNLQQLGLILMFNLIMFLLLEIPLVGYLVQPETTAARVAALSAWLNANGLRVVGALVGVMGLSLLAQGIAALAS